MTLNNVLRRIILAVFIVSAIQVLTYTPFRIWESMITE